jgi:hypothetical protein
VAGSTRGKGKPFRNRYSTYFEVGRKKSAHQVSLPSAPHASITPDAGDIVLLFNHLVDGLAEDHTVGIPLALRWVQVNVKSQRRQFLSEDGDFEGI